jgi:hypothetical protein
LNRGLFFAFARISCPTIPGGVRVRQLDLLSKFGDLFPAFSRQLELVDCADRVGDLGF